MPEQILDILPTLGPTAIVSIVAFWAIAQMFKYRKETKNGKNGKNGNGTAIIIEAIKQMRVNDLNSIETKIEKLDDKMDRILNVLIEIRARLSK